MNKTILALAGVLFASAAHADVKLVQRVTIQNEQLTAMMASMSPDQKAQMAQLGFTPNQIVTTYVKGTQARLDFGQSTLIADGTRHTLLQINKLARTYSVQPLRAGNAGGVKPTVRDTGQTKTVLGRVTHRYTITVRNPNAPNGGVSGDVWAAPGLPVPPFSSLLGGGLQSSLSGVKGLPLLANIVLRGGQGGKTILYTVAQSVSVSPLPASVFALPAGYTKTPPGTSPLPGQFGGGGFGGQ